MDVGEVYSLHHVRIIRKRLVARPQTPTPPDHLANACEDSGREQEPCTTMNGLSKVKNFPRHQFIPLWMYKWKNHDARVETVYKAAKV